MKRIESNEYFDAVKSYFADQQVPARVYKFLLDTLHADDYKLSDELLYHSVDTHETIEDCFRFFTGTECILVLCSEPTKWEQRINLIFMYSDFQHSGKQWWAIYFFLVALIFTVYYALPVCLFYASGAKPTLPPHRSAFVCFWFTDSKIAKFVEHECFTIEFSESLMHNTTCFRSY